MLCGLILLCLCSCKKDNTKDTDTDVKYSTASIPEYTGTEGDTIEVTLSGTTTGTGSSINSVTVLPSGATLIDISKKTNNSSGSSSNSGTTETPSDTPEEEVFHDFVFNTFEIIIFFNIYWI